MVVVQHDGVIVSGADAGDYLQTQLTQDVVRLGTGESAWSFLLKPKSEIVALMKVTRSADREFALEMEAGWGSAVRNTIDEFLGRMDVSFDEVAIEVEQEPEIDRITRGWPRMGREIGDSTTPAMTGIVAETVAFDKGCYPGQEFVARVHYRNAAPPKRLVRIDFDGEASVVVGGEIIVAGEIVGEVTSTASGVALGYLKRSVDVPAGATVGNTAAELLAIRHS